MLFFYRATGITLWAIIKSAHPAVMAVLRFFFFYIQRWLVKKKKKENIVRYLRLRRPL